jgi:hypothetical protein
MHTNKRAGAVLLAVGIAGGAATLVRFAEAGPSPAIFAAIAVFAGAFLLADGPRAVLWVRTIAVFMFTGGVTAVVIAPLFQPLDLTFVELRLDPAHFAIEAAAILFGLCVTFWVTRELDGPAARDGIASAGITRWDMRMPARAGAGVAALAGLLLWLALHGQSADLAMSLAIQQLGPDYRYHLSWISSANNGQGTTVTGVVTAWNEKEIRRVLLHWETRRP